MVTTKQRIFNIKMLKVCAASKTLLTKKLKETKINEKQGENGFVYCFLESTKIIDRVVFNISEALFTLLELVPVLGDLFSTIPVSIGSDVLFMANLHLSGNALRNIQSIQYNLKTCPPNTFGYL